MVKLRGPLHRWVLIFMFMGLVAAPLAALWSTQSGAAPVYAAVAPDQSCSGDSHVVVKPASGIDDVMLNAEYGTITIRKFYGTDIYVLEAPSLRGAKKIVRNMLATDWVIWAESGQFNENELLPNTIAAAELDQFSQAALDQFSAAALDQFSAAALDQFSAAALDQFSQAMLDQFTAAALDQFSAAALDQFSSAVLDQFSAAILDQFSAAILDQFGQAALDQFTTAILDQFSAAALDQFSTAILDQFSAAALDQFNVAILDQFSAASLDQFSTAMLDQFSTAIMDQFNQAALDQFSVAALDQFSMAVADQFSTAIMDQFSAAIMDQFSAAILDQFSAVILDQFSMAMLDQFTVANLDQFSMSALDQFSTAIMDQFSIAVMDQFSVASLDQFSTAALDQFSTSALDQFSQAILDQFMQSILDQFDAAYFKAILIEVLDNVYGAIARDQEAISAINVPLASAYATGAGITVAVIDSGIRDHWFLKNRIAEGGWDFVDGDNDPTDEITAYDKDGDGVYGPGWSHGTHVAGIISLVAPDAKILPIRVTDGDSGAWSFIVAEAIEYAVDSGVDIINLSLGLPCRSNDLKWAMNYAEENGVVVIGSAGNDANEKLHYPAGYSNGVAVAATDNEGVLAPFSNYHENVKISAPGVNIYSAYGEGQFAWWSGTSQATPMVAGEAALLLQSDATLTPDEIRNLIKQSGKDVKAKNAGKELTMGGGLADTFAALNLIGGHLVADTSVFTSADSIDSPDLLTNTAEETDEIGEAWWDTNWQARTKITFDQWAPGENLVDFPVLVSLSSASVDFAKIMSGGADMRFIDDDGVTALPYEIEDWDDVAETANVWVKVPQIDAGSTSDHIWMYYNNASAADNQNSAGVWTNGYSAVWHLDETSGNTISDSTSNGNDGTKRSMTEPSPVTTGMIGGAQHFDGLDDFVTNNTLVSTQSLTMEAWVSPDALSGGWNTVIEVGDDQPWFGILGSSKIAIYRGSAGIESIAKVTLSTFNHIVVTHDGSTVRMWINGVEDTPPGSLANSNTATGFGVGYNGSDGVFDGIIDEARISDTVRSDDWVVAQYRSMSLTFNTFGNEEVVIESSLIADTTGIVGPTVDTITTNNEVAAAAEAAAADATAAVIEATDEAATAEADADAKAAAAAESEVKAARAQAESEAKAAALAEAEAASAKADAEAAALADTEAATVATKAEAEAAISAKAEARAAKKAAKAEARAAEKAAEAEAIAAEKAAKAEIIAETVTARSEARHESKRANGNRRGKK